MELNKDDSSFIRNTKLSKILLQFERVNPHHACLHAEWSIAIIIIVLM